MIEGRYLPNANFPEFASRAPGAVASLIPLALRIAS